MLARSGNQVDEGHQDSKKATRPSLFSTANDEAYWKTIQDEFNFKPNQIYMNSATLGLTPRRAMEDMQERFERLSRGSYRMEKGPRQIIADILGVKVSEISLTHNTTEGINIVAAGLPLKKRDEVIVTSHEHVGNALPWLNRARLDGIRLKVFDPAPTAAETLNRINDLITRRTRVIAVPHITCTTGQVLPIREISRLGRSKGIWVFLDGAHGPLTTALDLKDIDCDFYASCGHKWLCGPSGTGMLYVRESLLDTVEAR
ncbi:MAG: aminotransferase class V-fold PLP-dependent enzyme, partial [Bacteroidota bacterium]